MLSWTEQTIKELLDSAEWALEECKTNLKLPGKIIRKTRAVGIVPEVPGYHFPRESLEETVLVVQKKLEMSVAGRSSKLQLLVTWFIFRGILVVML